MKYFKPDFEYISNIVAYHPNNLNNITAVEIGNNTLYFSYNTLVAFDDGKNIYVADRLPGRTSITTYKHLKMIDPEKQYRVPFDELQRIAEKHMGVRDV